MKTSQLVKKICAVALCAAMLGGSAVTVLPAVSSTNNGIVANAAETYGNFEYLEFAAGITITKYTGRDTVVDIPSEINGKSVTSIGSYAFNSCSNLTSISIPDSVTSIGSSAFYWCNSLKSITIPDSMTSIGYRAFYGCSSLKSITIPDSMMSIGDDAFYGCSSLTSITIPDSVTSIGEGAFYNCKSLTSISIPDSVMSIGDWAFGDCTSLTSISIPNSVTSIGDWAFYNTAWYNNQPDGHVYAGKVYYKYKGTMPENTSVTIKEGTKGIAGSAFYWCDSLTSITIPDSVTSIGSYAFYWCDSLTSITIPDSVTSIGDWAFGYYYDDYYFDYKKIENFTIYGKTGSAAETYAKENGFKFIDIDSVVFANGISLNKTALTLETGTTETLTATVTPDNATDKTVTWTTSNSRIATVEDGKVTAIGAGTATITATTANGKTATATVTVTEPVPTVTDISKATVSGITNKTYTGKNITQSITVKLGDTTLKNGTDYSVAYKNNTNAGTATVTVTGKGNYSGNIEKTFTINKAASKISLAAQSKTYTGKTLAYSGKVTKSGSTGKITYTYYSDSACTKKATPKAAGTYYVKATVAADSNYKATTSAAAKFTISKASIAKFTATLSSTSYTYTGAARKPAVTVKNGSTTLKNATDYTVTYSSNKAIGTAKVTIKGKGNYTGTITKTFKIVPKTATLKTVTSPKTKQLKATWAKDTTATGYQIQYSTNSKFKSGNKTKTITKNKTTSATLTGLTKGKTYYVKVRAYKTVGKTKVYGAYSAVKKVKIK